MVYGCAARAVVSQLSLAERYAVCGDQVTFDIDANGILSVAAKDKGTGKTQDIKITGASTLSSDEVERMVNDAEVNATEDGAKREAVRLTPTPPLHTHIHQLITRFFLFALSRHDEQHGIRLAN